MPSKATNYSNSNIMQRGGTPRVSACWAASKLWTKSKAAVPWTCAASYKGVAAHCVCPVMRISCTDLSAAPAGVPSRPPAPPCLPAAAAGWTAATAAGAAGSQTAPQMPAGPVLNISGSHSQHFQLQGSCLQCSWALKSSAMACPVQSAVADASMLYAGGQQAQRGHAILTFQPWGEASSQ